MDVLLQSTVAKLITITFLFVPVTTKFPQCLLFCKNTPCYAENRIKTTLRQIRLKCCYTDRLEIHPQTSISNRFLF